MPDHRFLFTLNVSDHPRFDTMLGDLAKCVLERVGYAPPAIADILATLREALEQGGNPGHDERDVQFRGEAGQLQILVSYGDGREWRMARALPD